MLLNLRIIVFDFFFPKEDEGNFPVYVGFKQKTALLLIYILLEDKLLLVYILLFFLPLKYREKLSGFWGIQQTFIEFLIVEF